MKLSPNNFKRRLTEPGVQYGMWVGMAESQAAEIVAAAGFEWLVLDAEHAPNDLRSLLHQMQTVAAYSGSAVVRPPEGTTVAIKQLLDLGAQTILVPMVETVAQAEELVAAMHYPPRGVRGVAGGRGARWGHTEDYWARIDDEVCLIVQVETALGVENLEAITAVEGVDGVFIGPSDLGASLGHLGDPGHPEVRAAVVDALKTIRAGGKGAGVLSTDPAIAEEYRDAGANFVAVGVDTSLLVAATKSLRERFTP